MQTDSDTIRQRALLERLKGIIGQVSILLGDETFQSPNGSRAIVTAHCALMNAEEQWQSELDMLTGEI